MTLSFQIINSNPPQPIDIYPEHYRNNNGDKSEPGKEYWYRYERWDRSLDIFPCYCLEVVRKTNKGVWIKSITGYRTYRFVLYPDGKCRRYAYPTKELALDSMMRRRRREIQYLEESLNQAKTDLKMAEKLLEIGIV